MINIDKPITSIANTDKVSFAELWSTITTTWASETRTWLGCISLMTNGDRVTTNIINIAKP